MANIGTNGKIEVNISSMASEFLGMACIYDEAKPNGVIEFLNADKEIIERICIFGDQNDPQLSDSKS